MNIEYMSVEHFKLKNPFKKDTWTDAGSAIVDTSNNTGTTDFLTEDIAARYDKTGTTDALISASDNMNSGTDNLLSGQTAVALGDDIAASSDKTGTTDFVTNDIAARSNTTYDNTGTTNFGQKNTQGRYDQGLQIGIPNSSSDIIGNPSAPNILPNPTEKALGGIKVGEVPSASGGKPIKLGNTGDVLNNAASGFGGIMSKGFNFLAGGLGSFGKYILWAIIVIIIICILYKILTRFI